MPAPAGIVEECTRQCNHIGLAAGNDLLRLLRLADHADGARGDLRLGFDLCRKWHLITRTDRYRRLGVNPARGDADVIKTEIAQLACEDDGVFHGPATLDPIRPGNACAERHAG